MYLLILFGFLVAIELRIWIYLLQQELVLNTTICNKTSSPCITSKLFVMETNRNTNLLTPKREACLLNDLGSRLCKNFATLGRQSGKCFLQLYIYFILYTCLLYLCSSFCIVVRGVNLLFSTLYQVTYNHTGSFRSFRYRNMSFIKISAKI